ncbi:hypothetical protein [Methylobacterium sp. 22177]|uniref:hypothetical protein n=1 Tax=Methylobacterium sp. 22177 TaxID=3453885 RepID=UPI003F82D154
MPPAPTSVSASSTFVSQPQCGNPRGIHARATDHAVRRFAKRTVGVIVDEGMDDTAALAELGRRGVNVRWVRQTLSKFGGIGVANQAQAVIVNGLKLVIRSGAVVTVLAKNQMREPRAPDEAPAPTARCVLHADYRP